MSRGDLDDMIQQAQRTLDNPVVKKAFAHLEKEIIDSMAGIMLASEEDERKAISLLRDLQAKRRFEKKLMVVAKANTFRDQ